MVHVSSAACSECRRGLKVVADGAAASAPPWSMDGSCGCHDAGGQLLVSLCFDGVDCLVMLPCQLCMDGFRALLRSPVR